MKEMVKNMMNRRRQEEHNDETLFLDSILDCDLMDEEEVIIAKAHIFLFLKAFCQNGLFRLKIQNPKRFFRKRHQKNATIGCPVL